MRIATKIFVLLMVIVASFYVAIERYRGAKALRDPKKWNILVLSFCSLRNDVLSFYDGRAQNLSPNIEKFFLPGAYRLENGLNPHPWTALFHYQSKDWFRHTPNDGGYEVIGAGTKGFTRIPARQGRIGEGKIFAASLRSFRDEVLRERTGPFVATAHLSYMHYPYLDRVNSEARVERFLTAAEQRKLDSYLRRPQDFPDKLPLLMILTGDVTLVGKNRKTSKLLQKESDPDRLLGLVANPELIAYWKASSGFEEDVAILRKIYDANAKYMDEFIADALNLWGNEDLRESTIVIFTGDHGVMNMDHGELTHATALYDQALRYPLLMRMPRQTGGVVNIPGQTPLSAIALMLEKIMGGELRENHIEGFLRSHAEPIMVLRDCANKMRGLRVENKWKYIVRIADGEASLYDLESDPNEKINLATRMPTKVAELEGLYWANLDRFSGLPTKKCAPGHGAE